MKDTRAKHEAEIAALQTIDIKPLLVREYQFSTNEIASDFCKHFVYSPV
jgi:hypothetical protein